MALHRSDLAGAWTLEALELAAGADPRLEGATIPAIVPGSVHTDLLTDVGGQLNACSSGQTVNVPANGSLPAKAVNVGTYTSNGSLLFNGSTLGIRMQNANGSGVGNDAAFDNIRILDVTPQLDKAFTPTSVKTGGTSTLTFTVTTPASSPPRPAGASPTRCRPD